MSLEQRKIFPDLPLPKYVRELTQFGIKADVDRENHTITVSRTEINAHAKMLGIFACIDEISNRNPSWTVRYSEDR